MDQQPPKASRPGLLQRLGMAIAPGFTYSRQLARARGEKLGLQVDVMRRVHAGFKRRHGLGAEGRGRGYDAAKIGRRTRGWRAGGTSANAEVGPAQETLRARARDLVRNTPWATQAIRVLAQEIIGDGVRPNASVRRRGRSDTARQAARRLAERIHQTWADWAETTACDVEGRHTFYGLQALIARACGESGEALVRGYTRPSSEGLAIPLQLQVLEADHLDTLKTNRLDNGGRIIQGVEYNARGARVAYWLFPDHPGDVGLLRPSLKSVRVPADMVLHVFKSERIGQARGVPEGVSGFMRMHDLDDMEDALLVLHKIASCLVGFVHDMHDPDEAITDTNAAATPITEDEEDAATNEFQPGTWEHLGPGKDIRLSQPPSATGTPEYIRTVLQALAAAYGISYEALTNDLSKANFSNARLGHLRMGKNTRLWRTHTIVPQLCNPVFGWFIEHAVLANALPARARDVRVDWTPPAREWVQPEKEVQAKRDEIKAGLTTLPAAIRERGRNVHDVLEEAAETQELLDELGLVLDTDLTGRQSEPAGTTDDNEPAEDPETGEPEAEDAADEREDNGTPNEDD